MINGIRFIIDSGCNYNCFYCHHEGFLNKKYSEFDLQKLKMIKKFTESKKIYNISITGGEPFMYWDKLHNILDEFNNPKYKITVNTNLSLLGDHIDDISKYSNIEFHVNLSSLKNSKHKKIIKTKNNYLDIVLENIKKLALTKNSVCLNIPALKDINDDELTTIYKYAVDNNLKPRFLVLFPTKNELIKNVMSIEEIMSKFPNSKIERKYSYGRYDISSDFGNFEIVKCLCCDMECEICKKNTFIHITPDFNIKMCMLSSKQDLVDYSDAASFEKSVMKVVNNI